MRHLLSIEDLDRETIERICDRAASFAEVADRRDQEGPRAPRPDSAEPLLRGLDAHPSSFELAGSASSADFVNFAASGSSVEKGESLKDTVLTLAAQKARRDRDPHALAAPPRWSRAGRTRRSSTPATASTSIRPRRCSRHTLRARLGTLDDLESGSSGTCLHSRVARSNIQAFQKMGAHVTVAGPPTLIPRGIEAMGCAVRHTLDDLSSADVIYALRMQHERMSQSWVPSLREYAAEYQVNGRRLGPRQILMHPGPVNRGVELSGEVVDSPQAVILNQVEAGVVVRMAVLYEVMSAHPPARAEAPTPEPTLA